MAVEMKFEPAVVGKFTAITLGAGEFPQQVRGRVGGIQPVTFTWTVPAIRSKLAALTAIEARRLNGGAPQRTLAGTSIAVADVGAHLVKLTVTQGATLTATGVITIASDSLGPGGPGVSSVSIIFHQADVLYFYGSTDSEVAP